MEMAHRSQKAIGIIAALLALPLCADELTYKVRHERLWKDQTAELSFNGHGVTLRRVDLKPSKKPSKPQVSEWPYDDIQQIVLSPQKVILLLYRDRAPWLLGVDKEYELRLAPGQDLKPLYGMLKDKLDKRLVAAIADPDIAVTWEIPAKRLGLFKGAEGVLKFGPDALVFETPSKNQSRTWRMQDIDNVSSSGPFELTLTTHERAVTHYGSRTVFTFQLKRPLETKRLDLLWKRLNQANELVYLKAFQETTEP